MSPNVTVSHNVTISFFKLYLTIIFFLCFLLSSNTGLSIHKCNLYKKGLKTKYTCIPLGEER